MLNFELNPVEARVLGALVEKEITTPEYYPLSLNALVNACNQRSNRHPVMNLEESAVREALFSLGEKNLAGSAHGESRVTKFEHRLSARFNFGRPEIAVLCVLLLRGPQTPGELRGRTERMYQFDDLPAVEAALQRLGQREPPLVKKLARQPGTKESRWAHLLSGDVAGEAAADEHAPDTWAGAVQTSPDPRIERIESQVDALAQEITALRQEIGELHRELADLRRKLQ
jgi:uncharacterized protein